MAENVTSELQTSREKTENDRPSSIVSSALSFIPTPLEFEREALDQGYDKEINSQIHKNNGPSDVRQDHRAASPHGALRPSVLPNRSTSNAKNRDIAQETHLGDNRKALSSLTNNTQDNGEELPGCVNSPKQPSNVGQHEIIPYIPSDSLSQATPEEMERRLFIQRYTRARELESDLPDEPAWSIHTAGQLGEGMFATGEIGGGRIFWAETPIISTNVDFETGISAGQRGVYVRQQLEGLANADRDFILRLSQQVQVDGFRGLFLSEDESEPGLEATMRKYAFVTGSGLYGTESFAVFRYLSKLNHSCWPNAELIASDEPVSHSYLRALRTINAGEEITISYGHLNGRWYRNLEEIRRIYGFECICGHPFPDPPPGHPTDGEAPVWVLEAGTEQLKTIARSRKRRFLDRIKQNVVEGILRRNDPNKNAPVVVTGTLGY